MRKLLFVAMLSASLSFAQNPTIFTRGNTSGTAFAVSTAPNAGANVSVIGTQLQAVTFTILGSSDGVNYAPVTISTIGSPTITGTQMTATVGQSLFSIPTSSLTGLTNLIFTTQTPFTATSASFLLTYIPPIGPGNFTWHTVSTSPAGLVCTDPTIGYVYNGTGYTCQSGTWQTPPSSGGPPTGNAGGDLCSTYPTPSVCKVNGAAIPASTPFLASDGSSRFAAALPNFLYPPGLDYTGGVNGLTILQNALASAITAGQRLQLGPGTPKVGSTWSSSSNNIDINCSGSQVTTIGAQTTGFSTTSFGPGSPTGLRANGSISNCLFAGANTTNTADGNSALIINGLIQARLSNLAFKNTDIAITDEGDGYGNIFDNIAAGQDGSVNAVFYVPGASQGHAGSDHNWYNNWADGKIVSWAIGPNEGGDNWYNGQLGCGAGTSTDNPTAAAIFGGIDYLNQTLTGEAGFSVNNASFEGVLHCHGILSKGPVEANINGGSIHPDIEAIDFVTATGIGAGGYNVNGLTVGGNFAGPNLANVSGGNTGRKPWIEIGTKTSAAKPAVGSVALGSVATIAYVSGGTFTGQPNGKCVINLTGAGGTGLYSYISVLSNAFGSITTKRNGSGYTAGTYSATLTCDNGIVYTGTPTFTITLGAMQLFIDSIALQSNMMAESSGIEGRGIWTGTASLTDDGADHLAWCPLIPFTDCQNFPTLDGTGGAFTAPVVVPTLQVSQLNNSTGTVACETVKTTPTGATVATTSDVGSVVGIAASGAGTTGKVGIAQVGNVCANFDGTPTVGDWAVVSTATNGLLHDAGGATSYPTSGQVVGIVAPSINGQTQITLAIGSLITNAPNGGGVEASLCNATAAAYANTVPPSWCPSGAFEPGAAVRAAIVVAGQGVIPYGGGGATSPFATGKVTLNPRFGPYFFTSHVAKAKGVIIDAQGSTLVLCDQTNTQWGTGGAGCSGSATDSVMFAIGSPSITSPGSNIGNELQGDIRNARFIMGSFNAASGAPLYDATLQATKGSGCYPWVSSPVSSTPFAVFIQWGGDITGNITDDPYNYNANGEMLTDDSFLGGACAAVSMGEGFNFDASHIYAAHNYSFIDQPSTAGYPQISSFAGENNRVSTSLIGNNINGLWSYKGTESDEWWFDHVSLDYMQYLTLSTGGSQQLCGGVNHSEVATQCGSAINAIAPDILLTDSHIENEYPLWAIIPAPGGSSDGGYLTMRGGSIACDTFAFNKLSLVSYTTSTNTANLVTSTAATTYQAGDVITVAPDATVSGLIGTWTVLASPAPTATSFSVTIAGITGSGSVTGHVLPIQASAAMIDTTGNVSAKPIVVTLDGVSVASNCPYTNFVSDPGPNVVQQDVKLTTLARGYPFNLPTNTAYNPDFLPVNEYGNYQKNGGLTVIGPLTVGSLSAPIFTPTAAPNTTPVTFCALHASVLSDSTAVTGTSFSTPNVTFTVAAAPAEMYVGTQIGYDLSGTITGPYTVQSGGSATTVIANTGTTLTSGGTIFLWCSNQSVDGTTAQLFTANQYAASTFTGAVSLHATAKFARGTVTSGPQMYIAQYAGASQLYKPGGPPTATGNGVFKGVEYQFDMTQYSSNLWGTSYAGGADSSSSALSAYLNTNATPLAINLLTNTLYPAVFWAATSVATMTYVSGGTFVGTGNCTVTTMNGGGSGFTITLAVASNVAGAFTVTNGGVSFTSAPTSITAWGSCTGGATATGTVTVTSTLGPVDGNWVQLQSYNVRPN